MRSTERPGGKVELVGGGGEVAVVQQIHGRLDLVVPSLEVLPGASRGEPESGDCKGSENSQCRRADPGSPPDSAGAAAHPHHEDEHADGDADDGSQAEETSELRPRQHVHRDGNRNGSPLRRVAPANADPEPNGERHDGERHEHEIDGHRDRRTSCDDRRPPRRRCAGVRHHGDRRTNEDRIDDRTARRSRRRQRRGSAGEERDSTCKVLRDAIAASTGLARGGRTLSVCGSGGDRTSMDSAITSVAAAPTQHAGDGPRQNHEVTAERPIT